MAAAQSLSLSFLAARLRSFSFPLVFLFSLAKPLVLPLAHPPAGSLSIFLFPPSRVEGMEA